MAYINYIRLKKAAVALRSTEKSVLDIALDAGYDSHEGFTRAFTKRYGVSPSDYRKNNRAHVLSWADLIDSSVAVRFLHDNPDFKPIDTDTVIDELLETDAHPVRLHRGSNADRTRFIAPSEIAFKRAFL